MRPRSASLALIALAGCTGVGLDPLSEDSGSEDTAPVYEGAVYIESVSPPWGPTAGGTSVTVNGWGFGTAPVVNWGNLEMAVTVVSDEALVLTTPPTTVEAAIDVTVTTDGGTYTAYDVFTYSDHGPPEGTDTGTGPADDTGGGGGGVTPTGLTGGIVEMSRLQVACPGCFGSTEEFQMVAGATLIQPAAGSWLSWLPPVGSCAADPARNPPSSSTIDLGDWVYLNSGSTSIPMAKSQQSGSILYLAGDMDLSDYISNAAYDLAAPDGGSLGPISEDDVLATPEGFDSISPEALLFTTPQSAFSGRISKAGTQFTWSPSGGSGYFLIEVDVYNTQGTALLTQVFCYGYDNGAMFVPGNYFQAFPVNSLVAVYMYRYSLGEFVLTNNGSTIETAAYSGVLGTGVISN